jgi:hypothetical protein
MTKYPYRSHRRDQSACPERSRREAGTMAGQSGRFRRRRGDRRQRFFGTPFPGARKCCGPATAPAQGVVAENALPRQRCLVIPSHIRSGAERAAPQRAIAESLAENAETLRRSDVLHPQDLDLFLAGGRAHADHVAFVSAHQRPRDRRLAGRPWARRCRRWARSRPVSRSMPTPCRPTGMRPRRRAGRARDLPARREDGQAEGRQAGRAGAGQGWVRLSRRSVSSRRSSQTPLPVP